VLFTTCQQYYQRNVLSISKASLELQLPKVILSSWSKKTKDKEIKTVVTQVEGNLAGIDWHFNLQMK